MTKTKSKPVPAIWTGAARYSRDFPTAPDARRQLAFDVPADLHRAVRRKAKADGLSIRSVILAFLRDWVTPEK